MERRNNLRSTEETGKGRYSWQYAFSGIIYCGECGAAYRRHDYRCAGHNEAVWTCKQHIKSKDICGQLPIKERVLEKIWVRTLNGLIKNRDGVLKVVAESVSEAITEAGENANAVNAPNKIDAQIATLQARILELSRSRSRREIDAERYDAESRAAMERPDGLFAERDATMKRCGADALGKVLNKQVAVFSNPNIVSLQASE